MKGFVLKMSKWKIFIFPFEIEISRSSFILFLKSEKSIKIEVKHFLSSQVVHSIIGFIFKWHWINKSAIFTALILT